MMLAATWGSQRSTSVQNGFAHRPNWLASTLGSGLLLFAELPRRRVFLETLGIRRAGVVRPRPPLSNLIPGLRLPAPGSTLSLPQLPPYSPRCPLPQIPHIPPPGPHTSRLP